MERGLAGASGTNELVDFKATRGRTFVDDFPQHALPILLIISPHPTLPLLLSSQPSSLATSFPLHPLLIMDPSLDFSLLEKFQSLSSYHLPSEVSAYAQFLALNLPLFHKQPTAQSLLKSSISLLFPHIYPLVTQNRSLTSSFISLLKTLLDKDGGKYAWLKEFTREMNVKTQLSLLEMDVAMMEEVQPKIPVTDLILEEWKYEQKQPKIPVKRRISPNKSHNSDRFKLILPLNFALVQFVPLNSKFVPQMQRFEAYLIDINSQGFKLTLRPGLENFLSELNQFADLHLFTDLKPEEVFKILEIIDKNGVYFKKRVFYCDENGKKSIKSVQISENDLDLVLILDISLENWSDSHPLFIPISLFSPSAESQNRPKALDYKLFDSDYGIGVSEDVVIPEDYGQLMFIKTVLKQTYAMYGTHSGEYTAIYEFREVRNRVLEDVAVSFRSYEERLGTGRYTVDRYRTLRTVASELGARETEEIGLNVVETDTPTSSEVSANSLLRVYYRCSRL